MGGWVWLLGQRMARGMTWHHPQATLKPDRAGLCCIGVLKLQQAFADE